jgi:AraC-like DNA-binding protein
MLNRSVRKRITFKQRLNLSTTVANDWYPANSPDSVTVTTVASRCGFVHLGRIASQYRQLFGESPLENTARQGRRVYPIVLSS